MTRLSETAPASEWLSQFSQPIDRIEAARILDVMTLVSHDALLDDLRLLILKRSEHDVGLIGLYVEREIRRWKGVPNRLFRESKKNGHLTAHGSGPRPIQPTQTYNPEIGSEGLIAWLVTALCREFPDRFTSHPGPDEIRSKNVKRFLLVTDFIGTGQRAVNYLSAAWRIASVKSWYSGDLLSFGVIAYSGLESGLSVVRSHATSPLVTIVMPCPSLDNKFSEAKAQRLKSLCRAYDPLNKDPVESLGYGGGGALIAFAHGCPNNAPRILHATRQGKWRPLFPKRVTAGVRERIEQEPEFEALRERFQSLGAGRIAEAAALGAMTPSGQEVVLLLAALQRGPRHSEAVASRTGLTLIKVEKAKGVAISHGWIDASGRMTDAGSAHLRVVGAPPVRTYGALPQGTEMLYIPKSLRAP